MKLQHYILTILSLVISISCNTDGQKSNNEKTTISAQEQAAIYREKLRETVTIQLIDQYTRAMGETKGTITSNGYLMVPLSKIQGAYSAKVTYLGDDITPTVLGFVAYDADLNIALLKPSGRAHKSSTISADTIADKTLYETTLSEGKIKIPRIETGKKGKSGDLEVWCTDKQTTPGTAYYNNQNELAAFATPHPDFLDSTILIPGYQISKIIAKATTKPSSIYKLKFESNTVYTSPEKVVGFEIITTDGNIEFKVYDQLPTYKKNLIKLCTDGYYDSLLVHRILNKFLIQLGAADTKYAKTGDPVGWQGPGYNMPTIITPGLFHKRGAIAASKIPDYKNPDNRSDAAQFYIIAGRKFDDSELDDIERRKHITFTREQRKFYRTIGGAPYLDGDYTIFGEVTKGLDILDYISGFPTDDNDRPLKDIRLKTIKLIIN